MLQKLIFSGIKAKRLKNLLVVEKIAILLLYVPLGLWDRPIRTKKRKSVLD